MAEPADVTSLATGMRTGLSFSAALSGFPSLLQDVLNLFARFRIRDLPANAMKSNVRTSAPPIKGVFPD